MAFADIPLVHGDAAIEEMGQALNEPGLHGACLQTNYDGKPLDVPEFRLFFEEANRLRAVIHVYPVAPTGTEEALRDYFMGVILGYPYDTTLTFVRLAYTEVLEQCPNLTFILSHAGGTIPFLWWRISMPYIANQPGSHDHIKDTPTSYWQRCCYDTALSDTESLMSVYRCIGGDHLIFSTDIPSGTRDVPSSTP